MKIDGRCHCGYLSFEAEADPQNVSICHCTDCQGGSGTAFRTSIRAPGASFKMLSGEPTRYLKTTAESGNHRVQAFCPICGTPIYSTAPGDNPDAYMIRTGTLRQRDSSRRASRTGSARRGLGSPNSPRSRATIRAGRRSPVKLAH